MADLDLHTIYASESPSLPRTYYCLSRELLTNKSKNKTVANIDSLFRTAICIWTRPTQGPFETFSSIILSTGMWQNNRNNSLRLTSTIVKFLLPCSSVSGLKGCVLNLTATVISGLYCMRVQDLLRAYASGLLWVWKRIVGVQDGTNTVAVVSTATNHLDETVRPVAIASADRESCRWKAMAGITIDGPCDATTWIGCVGWLVACKCNRLSRTSIDFVFRFCYSMKFRIAPSSTILCDCRCLTRFRMFRPSNAPRLGWPQLEAR